MSRPTLYRPDFARKVELACRLGAIDAEIADLFGVTDRTINRWKVRHAEFCQSLKRGKTIADANVAARLYERAVGYSHEAIRLAVSPSGGVAQVAYVRHYPPDTTAAIFWLKNRQPGKWSDTVFRTGRLLAGEAARLSIATNSPGRWPEDGMARRPLT